MQETKKFAFDVSVIFVASIVAMLFTSVITIILGRYLGPAELGLYKMAVTFYGIATLIGAFGLPEATVKYISENKTDKVKYSHIVTSAIITSLIFGLIFAISVYALSGAFAGLFKMPDLEGLLKILSIIFPFVLLNSALFAILNGLRKMNTYAAGSIFQSILMIVVTAALIYLGFGVAGAVAGIVCSSIGTSAAMAWTCRRDIIISSGEYLRTTRELMNFGVKMFAANLINTINLQADTIFLGYFLTASDVGYYTASTGISRFFWLVPKAIQMISYPATSEYWAKKNHASLQRMIEKSMKYTALALFPTGLGIGLFAGPIVTRIYGQEFINSALPLQILLVATVIFGVACTSIGGSLAGVNRPDLNLKISGVSAVLNIALNIVLIPMFGILGAAVAAATAMLTNAVLFDILTVRTLSVKIEARRMAEIGGMASISAILFLIGGGWINPYLLGSMLTVAFTALTFKLLLTEEDLFLLRSILSRTGLPVR